MPHHDSFIVGNKNALLELRKAIDVALIEGSLMEILLHLMMKVMQQL
ncbi:hypothetical protein [Bacillus andreraoultii]|nr:hypothetical protein [Bacillus andreraoultii]